MRSFEASTLKKGDLVVVDHRNKAYAGMVLEVEDITSDDCGYRTVTLKQPGFNNEFRVRDYDTRHLQKYEP